MVKLYVYDIPYNLKEKSRPDCSICRQNASGHILREVVDFNTRYENQGATAIPVRCLMYTTIYFVVLRNFTTMHIYLIDNQMSENDKGEPTKLVFCFMLDEMHILKQKA